MFLPLPRSLFPFVLAHRGPPLSRESGVRVVRESYCSWKRGGVGELTEVFGDQGLVWKVLFVGRGRTRVGGVLRPSSFESEPSLL